MPDIQVVHDLAREKSSEGRKAYTLTIDGQPTMYWCPTEYAAKRVAQLLLEGRSGEAFGGAGIVTPGNVVVISRGHDKSGRGKVVSAGDVTTETVITKSGRTKVREKRPGFLYELDGKAHENKVVATEQEAKTLCAIHAFCTRGKLGRFEEAEKTFRDQYGKGCKVHVINLPGSALHRKLVAKDDDGGLWHVGMRPEGGPIKFVLVVPAPPK